YSLPFVQFDFVAARTLGGCDEQGRLKIDYAVTATGNNQSDSSQTYLIDYRSLSSMTKISGLKVSFFPNGMLQSINASAEDRTGQIIVNTVTALGTIAATIASGGAPIPEPARPENVPSNVAAPDLKAICRAALKPEIRKALDSKAILDAKLAAATDELKSATARLTLLSSTGSVLGGRLDAASQSRLLEAVRFLSTATERQAR